MSINLLHISTATTFRGGEQQVLYLIESLTSFKVNQTLICPKNAALNSRINNNSCEIINSKKPKSVSLSLISTIKKTLKSKDINIIHVHDSKAQTAAVIALINNKSKIKLIVTRRVIFPVKGYLSKLKYRTKIVDKIICISKAVETEMHKIVDKQKTKIIHSAIDVKKFDFVQKKTFPFFNDENIKVAYVAALSFEKDHFTFLKTAELILQKNKNISFYIVGQGKLKTEIEKFIEEKKLKNNIFLTGFIDDIKNLIPHFNYLLFTSKSEGLGTTILDFYLAKIPVITTSCGGNAEISLHRKTAMVSEIEDFKSLATNFEELYNNDNLKNRLITNAYNLVVDNYSISDLGKRTFNLYNKIIHL